MGALKSLRAHYVGQLLANSKRDAQRDNRHPDRHRVRDDPPRARCRSSRLHDFRCRHFVYLSDLVSCLSRRIPSGSHSIHRRRLGKAVVLHDSDFAYDTRGDDRAFCDHYVETGAGGKVCDSQEHRAVDVSDVAVRFGDRSDRLPDALSSVSVALATERQGRDSK